jgi:DNA repair exonuclease SbcCD ATPase subunit
MITLKRLRVSNFLTLKHVDIELGPEIFLITAENRDEVSATSNGAGKSLLCESIVWCLFEEILRKNVKVDDVVGPSSEGTSIIVDLEKGGQQIRVERYRKDPTHGNKVLLFVDESAETLHSNTNQKIQQILGINPKTIYHCAYGNSEKDPIVALTPAGVKDVVSEILDIKRFDDYVKAIKALSKQEELVLNKNLALLERSGDKLMQVEEKVQLIEIEIGEFAQKKEQRVAQIGSQIVEVEVERDQLSELLIDEESIEERLVELSDSIDSVGVLNKKLKRYQENLDEVGSMILKLNARLSKAQAASMDKKKSLANIENNSTGLCGYCGNLLVNSEHLSSIQESLGKEINEALVVETDLAVKMSEAQVLQQDLQKKVTRTQKKLSALQEDMSEFTKLQNSLKKNSSLKTTIASLESKVVAMKEKIKQVEESSPPEQGVIQHLAQEKKELEAERKLVGAEYEKAELAIQDYTDLQKAVASLKLGLFNNFIYSLYSKIEEYLEEMTGGDFLVSMKEAKSELSFLFSSPSKGGKFFSYTVFSKGERARIRKAVQMAIESLMNVGFIIDDEGLEGVDDAGIPMILDFMLEKSVGKTVFIVGHQQSLKDYFGGYKNIHVTKEAGVSTVEVREIV